jgi:hypothetical protein
MLFGNLDIEKSSEIRKLCKTIVRSFLKEHGAIDIHTEGNILRDYICVYITPTEKKNETKLYK